MFEAITKLWLTDERNPRILHVKGRSGIDPDVLVAFPEGGSERCYWIIDGGNGGRDGQSKSVVWDGPAMKARPVAPAQ